MKKEMKISQIIRKMIIWLLKQKLKKLQRNNNPIQEIEIERNIEIVGLKDISYIIFVKALRIKLKQTLNCLKIRKLIITKYKKYVKSNFNLFKIRFISKISFNKTSFIIV